jgi:prepilin-type N-terminal cleavage/methylation domain-containing protein
MKNKKLKMKNSGKSKFFLAKKFAYHNFSFFNFPFSFRFSLKQNGGFTIVELLVVVSIIALIASSVFVLLSGARAKGRDATREQHIKTLQTALDSFYTNARSYPACNVNPPPATPPGDFITGGGCASVETELADAQAVVSVPRDPLNQGNFRYRYYSDGPEYIITYYLETGDIPGKSAGENRATP